jgi:hypothetical protein
MRRVPQRGQTVAPADDSVTVIAGVPAPALEPRAGGDRRSSRLSGRSILTASKSFPQPRQ